MGLLSVGAPLGWAEIIQHTEYVKKEGICQFLRLYQKLKGRTKHTLQWGDEVEYTLVRLDSANKDAQVLLVASDLLDDLNAATNNHDGLKDIIWQPEYGDYMIEGLPGMPYGRLLQAFSSLEANMRKRRNELNRHLPKDCYALTITAFPRLGCPGFTFPRADPTPIDGISNSLFFPDRAIHQKHPRFRTLTRNIRERRGAKVAINVPIYKDINTPCPFIEDFSGLHNGLDASAISAALPDHVYMDAMGFGMGCSCLQMTFQACCVEEARVLYDQLATICPIVMALSAATPAIRGYLLDVDCRWGIISASVDDRTEEERGLKPLTRNRFVIQKSRYDSISSYLSKWGEQYNDIPLVYDKEYYRTLTEGGLDHALAQHIAHLFVRDPVSVFAEKLVPSDDPDNVDHFENIQSTNWQSMRFKPPPAGSSIGWRVEFRPTELQLTDFENAAFVTFILLMSRIILKLKLNLLIPISKVDENMATAVKRDAVRQGMFYFRRSDLLTTDNSPEELATACAAFGRRRSFSTTLTDLDSTSCCPIEAAAASMMARSRPTDRIRTDKPSRPLSHPSTLSTDQLKSSGATLVPPAESFTLMSINEIINGSDTFPGLVPLIRHYVHSTGGDLNTITMIHEYLNLIQKRASGELLTTASWLRSRIVSHPDYRGDSYISARLNADLMAECVAVSRGELRPPDLLPSVGQSSVVPSLEVVKNGVRVRQNCRQCCYVGVTSTSSTEPSSVSGT